MNVPQFGEWVENLDQMLAAAQQRPDDRSVRFGIMTAIDELPSLSVTVDSDEQLERLLVRAGEQVRSLQTTIHAAKSADDPALVTVRDSMVRLRYALEDLRTQIAGLDRYPGLPGKGSGVKARQGRRAPVPSYVRR
jgi:hypothetical protein